MKNLEQTIVETYQQWEREMNEATLSRVWKMASDEKYIFAMLTAFRDENTPKKNQQLNQQLKKEIRSNGYGYFNVEGHWIENEGTPDEVKVKEESFFVSVPKDEVDDDAFKNFVVSTLKKYNQDAAVIKLTDNNVSLIDKNGKVFAQIGKFNVNRVASMYSKLQNGKSFVFESAVAPETFANQIAKKYFEDKYK
jgi:uncharacterized protein (DUF2267 family)